MRAWKTPGRHGGLSGPRKNEKRPFGPLDAEGAADALRKERASSSLAFLHDDPCHKADDDDQEDQHSAAAKAAHHGFAVLRERGTSPMNGAMTKT